MIDKSGAAVDREERRWRIDAMAWLCGGLMALALMACSKTEPVQAAPAQPTAPQSESVRSGAAQPAPTDSDDAVPGTEEGDAGPASHAFELRISLSKEAAEKLESSKEGAVAFFSYAGDPAPGTGEAFVDELGQIDLGQAEEDITGKSEVMIDGRALKVDRLRYVRGEPRVNVNIASARRVFEDNILDCDSFDDDLKVAIAAPVVLHCKLLDWPAKRIR
ncbi:hypothetical protein [Pseudoxanthomonas putridarboris]|uniref:Lipid/polyisoprenoid-binding YceI-like domain-containing protein n=1 Tax=Pseudoxanthomonas putridarboris TaxID=752605 RepID=A0ABU9J3Q3_9GAMM